MPPTTRRKTATTPVVTEEATPVTTPVETPVVASTRAKRRAITPAEVMLEQLSQVQFEPEDAENPFARSAGGAATQREKLPDDHPVVQVFLDSYKAQRPVRFPSDKPDDAIALFRRIAAERNLGVRFKVIELDGTPINLPKREKGDPVPTYNPITQGRQVIVRFLGRDKKEYAPRVKKDSPTKGSTANAANSGNQTTVE